MFAEGGLSWVLSWLQDAELLFDTYSQVLDPIEHRPSHYWHNNCYATFQADGLGLKQLDIIGPDRIMWATDYPHQDGFPDAANMIKRMGLKPDTLRKVLAEGAKRYYDLS